MKANSMEIWARVTRGLEWVAAAEAQLLPGISRISIDHRDLFLDCDDPNTVYKLKTIDDAFMVWGKVKEIGTQRTNLKDLSKYVNTLPKINLDIPDNIKNLRITASFLGKRNYSRYDIEDVIGEPLSKQLGLRYIDSRSEDASDAVWCRLHLAHENGIIGIRTHPSPLHRRSWRTEGLAGALHPPVAAAMSMLADLHPSQTVIDPICRKWYYIARSRIIS